ncbi:MAG: hypothetical protein ACYDBT_15680 [Desulfobulbaceae bacterium]
MKKTILEIYGLAVCFVTLVCFVITLGIASYDLLEMSAPEFTLEASQYQKHQSNEAFTKSCDDDSKYESMTEDEITAKREKSYQAALESERRDATQSLIQCLIILVINCGLFWSHWLIAKKARGTNGT